MSEPRIGIDDVDGSARQVQISNTKGHVNGWTAVGTWSAGPGRDAGARPRRRRAPCQSKLS